MAGTLLAASAWLGVAGCTPRHAEVKAFVRSHETEVAIGHYLIRPPDALRIHAPGIQELDGALEQVRPDGKVALRLLGEVDVAGLTTAEVASKLRNLLARYYVDPEVIVNVSGFRSQKYYVFGEVSYGGAKPFTGRDTLLKALAEAQPTFLAWRARIRVVRPSPDPANRRVMIVNMDELALAGDQTQDLLLQPGDVIEVPPTPLAWIGHRIREVLYPVGPLLQAYTLPAAPLEAHDTYEDEFDDDGSDK
ncbi:MAG: polysaccharide biosynthesis/export family protein [Planctomycetota bacterium]